VAEEWCEPPIALVHSPSRAHGEKGKHAPLHEEEHDPHERVSEHLYWGLEEGEEKFQIILTTVLLLSVSYVSVLICILIPRLLKLSWVLVPIAILPVLPQMWLFFLAMRNFALCCCIEHSMNDRLRKKIARNCKLRKTIDQLHRLVQLKDLAMHADVDIEIGGAGEMDRRFDLIPPNEKRRLHELFTVLDADGSGEMTSEELRKALLMLGSDLDQHCIDRLVGLMDADQSGEIGFSEFAVVLDALKQEYTHEVSLHSPEFIKLLFAIFDKDKDGDVTFDEVSSVLTGFGNWNVAELSELFREMDSDGGGEISIAEFQHFVHIVLEG
jgi:Ca2+-binding EF-hand superfamily protein